MHIIGRIYQTFLQIYVSQRSLPMIKTLSKMVHLVLASNSSMYLNSKHAELEEGISKFKTIPKLEVQSKL